MTCSSHRVPKLVSDKNGKLDFRPDRKTFSTLSPVLSPGQQVRFSGIPLAVVRVAIRDSVRIFKKEKLTNLDGMEELKKTTK